MDTSMPAACTALAVRDDDESTLSSSHQNRHQKPANALDLRTVRSLVLANHAGAEDRPILHRHRPRRDVLDTAAIGAHVDHSLGAPLALKLRRQVFKDLILPNHTAREEALEQPCTACALQHDLLARRTWDANAPCCCTTTADAAC